MAFKTDIKKKEIRIQRQAQSLTSFQSKVAHGYDDRAALMKRLLAAAAALVLALAALVSWRMWRSRSMARHETAMAALLAEARGEAPGPGAPGAPAADGQAERMRAALPRLEELARTAPAPSAAVANGLAAAWRLQLGAEGTEGAEAAPEDAGGPGDPWSRLRLAQRSVALGRAQEALGLISPLRKKAGPGRAWSGQYWALLMQVRQMEGDRARALEDYAEYRRLYKGHPDAGALDKALAGV